MEQSYQIFITQDGSPTLIWPGQDGAEEKMHHSGGALSESFYIYHEALRTVVESGWPVKVLSLGLGLGYNELITIGEMQRSANTDFKIWSFESSEFLRTQFRGWLSKPNLNETLHSAYQNILCGVAAKLAISAIELKELARVSLADGRLELRGSFPEAAADLQECSCVYYDAFSKKMNPELWIEEELLKHLSSAIGSRCVLATYASTGALNRALKSLGFRLSPKKGFSGKRESTLAIREEIR